MWMYLHQKNRIYWIILAEKLSLYPMQIIDSLVDPIINPTLIIGDFEWREPITTLTDSLIACVCIFAFIVFSRYKGEKSESFIYFKAFFLFFGIGMLCSAWLGHGLAAYLPPRVKVIGWVINSAANLFLGLATLREIIHLIKPHIRRLIKVIFIAQVSIFIVFMLIPSTSFFGLAQLCSLVSLIGMMLPMHIFNFSKTKSPGSKLFIIAIGMGVLPGIIFNTQLSVNRWFNYHDISHVVMATIFFIIFLAARKFSFLKQHT
jgi:hypothetical protein